MILKFLQNLHTKKTDEKAPHLHKPVSAPGERGGYIKARYTIDIIIWFVMFSPKALTGKYFAMILFKRCLSVHPMNIFMIFDILHIYLYTRKDGYSDLKVASLLQIWQNLHFFSLGALFSLIFIF